MDGPSLIFGGTVFYWLLFPLIGLSAFLNYKEDRNFKWIRRIVAAGLALGVLLVIAWFFQNDLGNIYYVIGLALEIFALPVIAISSFVWYLKKRSISLLVVSLVAVAIFTRQILYLFR